MIKHSERGTAFSHHGIVYPTPVKECHAMWVFIYISVFCRCVFPTCEMISANESVIAQGPAFNTLPGVNCIDIKFTANDAFKKKKKQKTIIWSDGLNQIGFDNKSVRTAYI